MKKTDSWRTIESGINSAAWNMAVDEALLNSFREGDLPILRLYGWEPALSAGRFSKLENSIDMEKLKEKNISCVRRMSGGGILVHGGDLSYSLIMPRKSVRQKGVKESYRTVCGFLIRLYHGIGYTAEYACDTEYELSHSDICLAGNESYDILIGGKKIGGNAQRYTREAVFQHGSIPMRLEPSLFQSCFYGNSGLERAESLENLGILMTRDQLSQHLKEAFCKTFGVNTLPDTLNESEVRCAEELLASKYTNERWNIHGESIYP